MGLAGGGGEVHERLGLGLALAGLAVAGGLLGLGGPNLPEPGVVVDDADVLLVQEELAGLAGSIRVVPLLEVDEDALGVLLAVLARTLHHVDALDVSEADGFKDFLHTLLGDVGVDERDAEARLAGAELREIKRSLL